MGCRGWRLLEVQDRQRRRRMDFSRVLGEVLVGAAYAYVHSRSPVPKRAPALSMQEEPTTYNALSDSALKKIICSLQTDLMQRDPFGN
jgi:hypothetical protein